MRGEDMADHGKPPAVMPGVRSAGDPIPDQYPLDTDFCELSRSPTGRRRTEDPVTCDRQATSASLPDRPETIKADIAYRRLVELSRTVTRDHRQDACGDSGRSLRDRLPGSEFEYFGIGPAVVLGQDLSEGSGPPSRRRSGHRSGSG